MLYISLSSGCVRLTKLFSFSANVKFYRLGIAKLGFMLLVLSTIKTANLSCGSTSYTDGHNSVSAMLFVGAIEARRAVNVQLDTIQSRPLSYQCPSLPAA